MAPSCPRVIFLIDKSQFKDNKYRLQIHLACLRTLSYYAHNSVHQVAKSGVLWGYKFFNSSSQDLKYGCKRYPFLDFTTKCFDDFEKELYIIEERDTQVATTKDFSKNLKRTLTDLLSDFHWERPELLSPSKKSNISSNFDDVSNIVFLFCPAPVNKELNAFFGVSESSTKSQLLERFITKSLHVKFVKELKIKLYWVDSKYKEHSEMLLDESLLKKSLSSINGKLVSLRALTLCWLQSKKETLNFIDIINSQTLYNEVTNSLDADVSLCEYSFKINEESDHFCKMFICSSWSKICRSDNHQNCNVVFNGAVPKEKLKPTSLALSDAFFYILNFSECGEDILFLIQSTIAQKQVMKINWKSCCQLCTQKETEYIMIPCTLKFGTIVPFVQCEKEELEIIEEPQKLESDVIDYEDVYNDPLALVLKSKISNWEFGTALVNCVDTWFLYNPQLGFKHSARNIFRKLYKERILKAQHREEQSKELLTALRKSLKENKKEEEAKEKKNSAEEEKKSKKKKVIKPKRFKGVTWVRSRLKEYHRKLKESQPSNESANEEKETTEPKENYVELPKPLLVEEFRSQDEMQHYLQDEWANMVEKEKIKHRVVERFVLTPIQHFSSINEESCQEMGINFLKKLFFKKLNEIRSEAPKEQLSKQYLLQIHMRMECSTALQGHQPADEEENFADQIVIFLRALIFEESINFVQTHLKAHLVPYFIGRNKGLLLDIHEEMMFDIPSALESLQKERNEGESGDDKCSSPLRSIQMPSSFGGASETSSVCSQQQQQNEKRSLRRIPSAIGDNTLHQRMIAVTSSNKSSSRHSYQRKTSRNSLGSSANRSSSSSQPNPPKTPTLKRRHSEIIVRQFIPETPEGKQRNDLMWKKQELNRRVSKVDKRMEPIEESPLKQLASPVNVPSSSFHRSNSFSVRSSPRRFYAVRRINSQIMKNDGVEKDITNERKPKSMKNLLLANFQSPPSKKTGASGKCEEEMPRQQKATRRNIFSARSRSATSEVISFDGMSSSLSPPRESASSPPQKFKACKRLRLSESEDAANSQSKSLPPFENTLDWLADMERNNETHVNEDTAHTPPVNFREAFEQLTDTPEYNTSQTPHAATKKAYSVNCVGMKQSPTVIRAGREQITVSPLLSVSSIETLESAPILSPISKRKKKNKNRRTLTMD